MVSEKARSLTGLIHVDSQSGFGDPCPHSGSISRLAVDGRSGILPVS